MTEQQAAKAPPRSLARRILGYPLVTILIGFILFVPVFSIAFSAIPQVLVLVTGNKVADDFVSGAPSDPTQATLLGVGRLLAALILIPLGLLVYRYVIVRGCEGRTSTSELTMTVIARRWLVVGVLLSFAVIALTLIVVAVAGGLATVAGNPFVAGVASALGMALFAGVVEELFARGVLFRVSEQHVGSIAALIISAIVFGLQHADNPDASVISTLAVALEGGIMLCAVYMAARTLWAPMAVHFGWNFGLAILGIPVSGNHMLGAVRLELTGPEWLTGGTFGLEASSIALLIWTLIAIAMLLAAARRGRIQTWRGARTAVRGGTANLPFAIP